MKRIATLCIGALVLSLAWPLEDARAARGKKKRDSEAGKDPYANLVWPPPPDKARIKLEEVLDGRAAAEAKDSKWKRFFIGISPETTYDRLRKPFGVEFDSQGRILVTDWHSQALIRFDTTEQRMDVLGTRGAIRLNRPMGLEVAPDGTIFVADQQQARIVALDGEGGIVAVYGGGGQLAGPTDAALSPDGTELYVADSKAHRIVVFDRQSGDRLRAFGANGNLPGEFAFPTSLAFGPEGDLFVVDQLNARVQVFDSDDEYLDEFGGRGLGFGNFARPKDIAVDEVGFIYVTDNAFNNVQIFDADFTLLTFIGTAGLRPGQFHGISGVAVQGDRFAIVDQLGRRCQVFRFLEPKDEG